MSLLAKDVNLVGASFDQLEEVQDFLWDEDELAHIRNLDRAAIMETNARVYALNKSELRILDILYGSGCGSSDPYI
jgi:hypothetical protein